MGEPDWKLPFARCFGMLMVGQRLAERDERGNPVEDDDLLLLLNAHHDAIEFRLPDAAWTVLIDTARREWTLREKPTRCRRDRSRCSLDPASKDPARTGG